MLIEPFIVCVVPNVTSENWPGTPPKTPAGIS